MTDEMKTEVETPVENLQTALNEQSAEQVDRKNVIIGSLILLVTLVLFVLATIYLVRPENSAQTGQIRDVFIIFLGLVSIIIGIALVVLIVQLSTLINLLQNEIRPIINSTNETVNTLKGTAQFLSDNLAEPVIKLNQYAAMLKRIIKPSKEL